MPARKTSPKTSPRRNGQMTMAEAVKGLAVGDVVGFRGIHLAHRPAHASVVAIGERRVACTYSIGGRRMYTLIDIPSLARRRGQVLEHGKDAEAVCRRAVEAPDGVGPGGTGASMARLANWVGLDLVSVTRDGEVVFSADGAAEPQRLRAS